MRASGSWPKDVVAGEGRVAAERIWKSPRKVSRRAVYESDVRLKRNERGGPSLTKMSLLSQARRASAVASAVAAAGARRSLATDAPVKPQLQLYGIHARYANAVFSAASKTGTLGRVEKDLRQVQQWISSHAQFAAFLSNPIVKRQDKKATLAKVSAGMEPVSREFLAVLAENNRLSEADKILATFFRIMDVEHGVVQVTITTAEKLDDDQLDAVKAELAATTKGTLNVKVHEDPAILGGLQVQIGDKFIDLSVASKINNLSKALSVPAAE